MLVWQKVGNINNMYHQPSPVSSAGSNAETEGAEPSATHLREDAGVSACAAVLTVGRKAEPHSIK